MKRTLILLSAVALILAFPGCKESRKSSERESVAEADNSRNALDWQGTYHGILPCADCEGIETVIKISYDNTFVIQTQYLGKDERVFENRGDFHWDEAGSIITLNLPDDSGSSTHYQVGENRLFHLDLEGNRITDELADFYILEKVEENLGGRTWRLVEVGSEPFEMKEGYFHIPILLFDEEEMRFSGNAGCNTLMGSYQLEGENGLGFSQVASTLMACPDMELERIFIENAEKVKSYELSWDTLILKGEEGESLLRYEADYFLKY